jgi:hypothetical protein
MTIDLTGVWHCDDEGTYYIRQFGDTVVWAGLHDSGFHKGIEFANVFWGTVSPDGLSVSGGNKRVRVNFARRRKTRHDRSRRRWRGL